MRMGTSSPSSRAAGEEKTPSNGVRFSWATWVIIIFMAAGVVMPLRAKAASARALTSSGTLIWINAMVSLLLLMCFPYNIIICLVLIRE